MTSFFPFAIKKNHYLCRAKRDGMAMNGNMLKMKAIAFLFVLVVGMLLPVGVSAQNDDQRGGLFNYHGGSDSEESKGGLFRYGREGEGYNLFNQQFGADDDGGYNLNNQTFGQEVALGSGLLILAAAGAGYALKKKNNNLKREKNR